MNQTPIHSAPNEDLLKIMPRNLKRVVEVGCGNGGLARAYTSLNPDCGYIGIEIDPDNAEIAKEYCSEAICGNIESLDEEIFLKLFPSDCWVFGDVLEHLHDPWSVLRRIRPHMSAGSQIIACIPNAQHWSIQVKLNSGFFRYEDNGLLDRTHIRWFTRTTAIELFELTGYKIIEGSGRIFAEPERERFLQAVRAMADALGTDPEQAIRDATPLQWIIKAIPD